MTRKTAIAAMTLVVLSGLTGCTKQQIADAIALNERATANGPTLEVDATCDGITVTSTDWPEGSGGVVGIGSEPPYPIVANTTQTWPLAISSQGGYLWSAELTTVDDTGIAISTQAANGDLDCPGTFVPGEGLIPD